MNRTRIHWAVSAGALVLLASGMSALAGSVRSEQSGEAPLSALKDRPSEDRYGDPLPRCAVARLGTLRLRQEVSPRGVAFSPDGTKIVSVGFSLCLWNVADGRLLRRRNLIDGASLRQDPAISGIPSESSIPVFAPDGTAVALPYANKILVWNLAGKGETRQLGQADRLVSGCVYSANGKLLAWSSLALKEASPQTITVCQVESGKIVREIPLSSRIVKLCGSPQDNLVAAVLEDDTIGVWDVATGVRVRLLRHVGKRTQLLAFSPDGKELATGSWEARFSVWSLESGEKLFEVPFAPSTASSLVLDMAFVPPGDRLAALVFCDGAHKLVTCSAATGRRVETRPGWPGRKLVFAPDGKLVASPVGVTVDLRRFADGSDPLNIHGHIFMAPLVAFLPRGELLSWGMEGKTLIWDRNTTLPTWELSNIDYYYPSACGPQAVAAFPARNLLAVVHRGRGVDIWNSAEKRREKTIPIADEQLASAVQFSPDGKSLACGDLQGRLFIFDIQSGRVVRSWDPHHALHKDDTEAFLKPFSSESFDVGLTKIPVAGRGVQIQALAWSPNGKIVVSATCERARWLDVETGEVVRESPGSKETSARWVTFSPNGRFLAELSNTVTGTKGCVVWDAASGRMVWKDSDAGSSCSGSAAAFSPDSLLLAQGVGSSIRLVDAATGRKRAIVSTDDGTVLGIAFSADGRLLAASFEPGTILVFDVAQMLASRQSP